MDSCHFSQEVASGSFQALLREAGSLGTGTDSADHCQINEKIQIFRDFNMGSIFEASLLYEAWSFFIAQTTFTFKVGLGEDTTLLLTSLSKKILRCF